MKHELYWLSPKLKVKKTIRCGMGTYAANNVKKNELLLVVGGHVVPLEDERSLPDSISDSGMQITDDLSICAVKENELGGINFVNHSCDPNAGIRGQIFLVAMRSIKKGEEITFDYAMTLYHSKNAAPYRLKCLCGKSNCRRIITDNDWKKNDLQKKYKGYFQFYIQEKINKLKHV